MNLSAKLQIKPGQTIALVNAPDGMPIDIPGGAQQDPARADVVIAFVRTAADLDGAARAALKAARSDRLAWISYPKAGQLGTDLNRDGLAAAVSGQGLRPVRQVSIDATWSALRFRPDDT